MRVAGLRGDPTTISRFQTPKVGEDLTEVQMIALELILDKVESASLDEALDLAPTPRIAVGTPRRRCAEATPLSSHLRGCGRWKPRMVRGSPDRRTTDD